MHASRIGTVFGRDLDDMERWIERKTTEVTSIFRRAEKHLQKVGILTRRVGGEGSALADSLKTVYENCGIEVLVAYGLTESSPLLATWIRQ